MADKVDLNKINKIKVDNEGNGISEALESVERLAASLELSRKDKFYMRLLAEETLGMVGAIVGKFQADFWIEWHDSLFKWQKGGTFKIHLEANTDVSYSTRRELVSVSTKNENIAPRGIMEKIREMVEAGLHGMDEILKLQTEYGGGALNYGLLGAMDVQQMMYSWSMQKYKNAVDSSRAENKNQTEIKSGNKSGNFEWEEAWDELEKSIIANIADDVQIGVSSGHVEVIVIKDFLNV